MSILSKRDVDGVVPFRRTIQLTDEQEVGAKGKSQPEVLPGVGRGKISTKAVSVTLGQKNTLIKYIR